LRALTYKIVQLMSVPLVQSTLRSAYRVGFNQLGAAEVNAGRAEAAACAAALLPLLYYCDSRSGRNAAEMVANQMELGSASVDFTKVKNAVEQSYQCLGITCIEVGGLWDAGNGSGAYRNSASPCVDSQQSQVSPATQYHASSRTILFCRTVLLLLLRRTSRSTPQSLATRPAVTSSSTTRSPSTRSPRPRPLPPSRPAPPRPALTPTLTLTLTLTLSLTTDN
jgi:hypothetical protein